MPKLIILGQGSAVVAAALKMRAQGPDWQVVILSTDGERPYDRSLFPKLIARTCKEKDVFCISEEDWTTQGVEIVLNKEVTRINPARHKIYLSERTQMDFDALIIADAPEVRVSEKKGVRKAGVFHLARLDSVRKMIKYLLFTETIVLETATVHGIEAALALKTLGKEVLVVNAGVWPTEIAGVPYSVLLEKLLEKRGIRFVKDNPVEDIIGEGEVRAVRLKSGKVVAAEMVIMDEAVPDLRFLSDGELVLGERIMVMDSMRTNMADVYAVDAVMEMATPKLIGSYFGPPALGCAQAEVAVAMVLGQEAIFVLPTQDHRVELERIFSSEDVHWALESVRSQNIVETLQEADTGSVSQGE